MSHHTHTNYNLNAPLSFSLSTVSCRPFDTSKQMFYSSWWPNSSPLLKWSPIDGHFHCLQSCRCRQCCRECSHMNISKFEGHCWTALSPLPQQYIKVAVPHTFPSYILFILLCLKFICSFFCGCSCLLTTFLFGYWLIGWFQKNSLYLESVCDSCYRYLPLLSCGLMATSAATVSSHSTFLLLPVLTLPILAASPY